MVNKETPARSQPKDSDTAPATQWTFISPTICEMRQTENEGWANKPTARSEVAKDRRSALDGVWSDGVFHTAKITSTFPKIPGRRNTQFKMEQIRLWMNKYSGSSTESVKNRQGFTGSVADWFWFIMLSRTRFLSKLVCRRWTRKYPLSWTEVGMRQLAWCYKNESSRRLFYVINTSVMVHCSAPQLYKSYMTFYLRRVACQFECRLIHSSIQFRTNMIF